jgi:hypothetical protein
VGAERHPGGHPRAAAAAEAGDEEWAGGGRLGCGWWRGGERWGRAGAISTSGFLVFGVVWLGQATGAAQLASLLDAAPLRYLSSPANSSRFY